MKQIIRLTESDLHRIIKKSVNRIMEAEGEDDNFMTPLQRIKANGPKIIGKIDLPEPKPRKPKGPKRTTFADLPSAEKLKNLKVNKTQSADDINIDSVVTPEQMAAVKSGHINIPSLFENRINRIVKESVNSILAEISSFDMMKYEKMSEYRQTDPMSLSDSELRHAIDYMFAYRWALEGEEQVLSDYIEEAKRRGLED